MPLVLASASQRFPAVFYLCLGAALAMLITALVYHNHATKILQQRNDDYGQALASMASSQAVDATLNHDLVSLQVILHDVVQNAGVQRATIHDVENRLLVQADNNQNRRQQNHYQQNNDPSNPVGSAAFTATITLHDSVAGYVTVNLNSITMVRHKNLWLILAAVAAVLIAVAAAAVYQQHKQQTSTTVPVVSTTQVIDEVMPLQTQFPTEYYCTRLILSSLNLEQLQHQLNGQMLKQLLDQLEKQMHGVMSLYNGELINTDCHPFQLAFYSNNSQQESTFHAVCGALLLLSLHAESSSKIHIHLNAAVLPDVDDDRNLYQRLNTVDLQKQSLQLLQQQAQNTLLVAEQLLTETDLEQRLSFQPQSSDNGFANVLDIREPYLSLLEKQRRQLRELR